jgi:hypothetical protein
MADQVAENVATSEPVAVTPEITQNNSEAVHADKSAHTEVKPPVKGPADDLRSIQNLLVSGIFPGNLAPAVVQGFRLLDEMAKAVEAGSLKMVPKESK